MDTRLTQYLEVVPLPVVPVILIVLFIGYVLIPSRLRLDVFLALLVIVLTLGRLPDLGIVQAFSKVGASGVFGLVLITALLDPYPKRQLSGAALFYPVLALYSFVFIITVTSVLFAFALRVQWLMLILAALATARCITDQASLMRVLRAITIGICVALLVALAGLLRDPAGAFRAGLGRFEPWGAASNIIGIFFGLATVMCLICAWYAGRLTRRLFYLGFAFVAIGLCLLTASRASVAVMMIAPLPIAVQYLRKPVFAVIAGVMAVGVVTWILGFTTQDALSRLQSLDTGRAETARMYLDTVISQRPLAGLLETRDMSVLADESAAMHPHNAYIETAYLGGAMYALPMFMMIALTMYSTVWVWLRRRSLPYDPLLVTTLASTMMMVYAHGFVNGAIYYPTYAWAFMHILLSILFLSIAADIRRGDVPALQPVEAAEEVDDGYDLGSAAGYGVSR